MSRRLPLLLTVTLIMGVGTYFVVNAEPPEVEVQEQPAPQVPPVSFIGARHGGTNFYWLVEGIVAGRLAPQASFGESVGLSGDQLEAAWRGFILSQ